MLDLRWLGALDDGQRSLLEQLGLVLRQLQPAQLSPAGSEVERVLAGLDRHLEAPNQLAQLLVQLRLLKRLESLVCLAAGQHRRKLRLLGSVRRGLFRSLRPALDLARALGFHQAGPDQLVAKALHAAEIVTSARTAQAGSLPTPSFAT